MSRSFPVDRCPSSWRWASAASARGNSPPTRTFNSSEATHPRTSPARHSSSSRLAVRHLLPLIPNVGYILLDLEDRVDRGALAHRLTFTGSPGTRTSFRLQDAAKSDPSTNSQGQRSDHRSGRSSIHRFLENQWRMRLNGEATIDCKDPLLTEYPEAQFIVRVRAREIFPNCSRIIHRMELKKRSRFTPKAECATPVPSWKKGDFFHDVLPVADASHDDTREVLAR